MEKKITSFIVVTVCALIAALISAMKATTRLHDVLSLFINSSCTLYLCDRLSTDEWRCRFAHLHFRFLGTFRIHGSFHARRRRRTRGCYRLRDNDDDAGL